jgi:nucleotide-binding universal stress UspA family protein
MTNLLGDLGHSMKANFIAPVRRRLLCASDMTPRSGRAIQRAAILANQMNADVLFVHVVSDRQPERVVQLKANRARVRLMVQAERAMAHAPDSARVEIHLGRPLKVIADIAKQCSVDLIVLAAPVARRYERLMGTTAERIVRSVTCPVLFVSSEAVGAYTQVAVAIDPSKTSVRAAQAASRTEVLSPQLLLADVSRNPLRLRSLATLSALSALRTHACDVLLFLEASAHEILRAPTFFVQSATSTCPS